MGVLTTLKNTVANKFPAGVQAAPEYVGADFPDGLRIRELEWSDGSLQEINYIRLAGTNMPFQPFEWEGKQRIIKEYYPGNIEPAMQVLGPEESNITLKGRFKAKRLHTDATTPGFQDPAELRLQPYELQEYFDAMRLRGNVIEISFGEWIRYGFIERAKFMMRTLADIDYEIEFNPFGPNEPFFNFFADQEQTIPYDINTSLAVNGAFMSTQELNPELPTDIFDELSSAISAVAGAIAVVTNFIDGVMSIADDVTKHYNRILGLCTYLRGQIAQYKRRVSSLALDISDAPAALEDYAKQSWLMINSKSLYDLSRQPSQPINMSTNEQIAALGDLSTFAASRSEKDIDNRGYPTYEQAQEITSTPSLDILVARLIANFEALATYEPVRTHIMRKGDTLQKISLIYYGTPYYWYRLYLHNKLNSFDTSSIYGTIIEIPRIKNARRYDPTSAANNVNSSRGYR